MQSNKSKSFFARAGIVALAAIPLIATAACGADLSEDVGSSNQAVISCPPGKVQVLIETPAGNEVELCVASDAVDGIGGQGGGPIVIPASCPCFTLEEVMASAVTEYVDCRVLTGSTSVTHKTCTYGGCDNSYDFFAAQSVTDSEGQEVDGVCVYEASIFRGPANNMCEDWGAGISLPAESMPELSEEETAACIAILGSIGPRAENVRIL